MAKYTIIIERTYLNSCDLTDPDGKSTFEKTLELEPGVTLTMRMEPKGNSAPDSPSQLTHMCVLKVEGICESEMSELQGFDSQEHSQKLMDESIVFRNKFRSFIDATVFFISQVFSPWLFFELKSETIHIGIGNQFMMLLDRHSTPWYPGLKGRIDLKKLETGFHNLNLLCQEEREFLDPFFRAFHWHAIAIERTDPIDRFIAAFTGLEVILNTERLPKNEEYREYLKQICDLIKSSRSDNKDDLLTFFEKQKRALLQPPLRWRLEALLKRANSPDREEELREFDIVNHLRNEILHGRSIELPDIPLIAFNPKPFDNPLQSVLTLLERCIFYALTSRRPKR